MQDMLVKLYELPEDAALAAPRDESVQIRRALAPILIQNFTGYSNLIWQLCPLRVY